MKKELARKTCLNCGHEFTYRERLQSSYRLFWRMNCTACGTRYSVQMRYRFLFGLLCAIPVAAGPSLGIFAHWNAGPVLLVYLAYFLLLLLPVIFGIPLLPLVRDSAEKKDPNPENPTLE